MRWWHLKQIITLNYYIGDLTDYLFTGWLCQVWTSPGNPNLCLHRSGHQRHSESVWQRFLCDSERLFHCEVERPQDYCERCQEPLRVGRSPRQSQRANTNYIVFRGPSPDGSKPRNTQRSLDAGRWNSQSPVFRDSHDSIQARGSLGGRGSQSDARPRQQNYIHLSDEIQLFSYGCSGQSCQVSFSARGDNSQLNKTYSPAWPSGNFNRFPIFPEFFQCFQGLPNIGFHYSLKYSQSIEIFHVTNGYSVSMPEWLRLTIYPVCI